MDAQQSTESEAIGHVSVAGTSPGARTGNWTVPDAVRQRFTKIDDSYFFPDRSLAFRDLGEKLTVRTHNLAVVHSLVAIAQARGWTAVEITGTREFKRSFWDEAMRQGVKVHGYKPETEQKDRLRRKPPRERGDAARDVEVPAAQNPSAYVRQPPSIGMREITGELLAHGAAPYRFDPKQRLSYYVRVDTPQGERTVWGSDLERALAQSRSGVREGDRVTLREGASEQVLVHMQRRNAQGKLVDEGREQVTRRTWSVETSAFLATRRDKADIVRDASRPEPAMLAQYPDLAGVAGAMRLAVAFAQRVTERPDDQQRVVQAIREAMAQAVEQGATISPRAVPERPHAERSPPQTHRQIADPEQARS